MSRKTQRNLPVARRNTSIERSQYVQITYEAPLPPPRLLAEYEQTLPGISHRLVERMEQQTEHRMSLESRKIDADISNERRGQLFAFIIAVIGLLGDRNRERSPGRLSLYYDLCESRYRIHFRQDQTRPRLGKKAC
jgi:uncharacterized membrane protein